MSLLEGFIKDTLFIDFSSEILYGSDQVCMDYLSRFATVTFQLIDTAGLSQIVDRIRKDLGFKPMHPMDEFTDETCDKTGWYDFFLGINGFDDHHLDTYIEAIVISENAPDNEELYTIDLDENEQKYVFAQLDEQCRQHLGKSCEELLAEAGKRMEDAT